MKEFVISHWETELPSMSGVLRELSRTLYLLSNTLPLALNHIGTEDLDLQIDFWQSFSHYQNKTDLLMHAEGITDLRCEGIRVVLDNWREMTEGLACELQQLDGPVNDDERWLSKVLNHNVPNGERVRLNATLVIRRVLEKRRQPKCSFEELCAIPDPEFLVTMDCGPKTMQFIRTIFPYSSNATLCEITDGAS